MPGWVRWASLGLCAAGLLVSAYLTFEHFTTGASFACPENAVVNCIKVTTSPYSVVAGVPVAVAGLIFYCVAALACLPAAWRRPEPWIPWVRLGGGIAGVLFVLYLVWVELFGVGAICLWCTAVHVITVLLFACVLLAKLDAATARRWGRGAAPVK